MTSSKAGVIGYPVDHSLSPLIHRTVYAANHLDWSYERCSCRDADAVTALIAEARDEAPEWLGFNVTMPYKRTVLASADEMDASAAMVGGANVLCFEDRDGERAALVGYNTDGYGVVSALEAGGGCRLKDSRIAVCGTGATALSALVSFLLAGASEVVLATRAPEPARQLLGQRLASMERLAGEREGLLPVGFGIDRTWVPENRASSRARVVTYAELEMAMPGIDVLVDATPLGMKPGDPCVVDPSCIGERHTVLDVVYGHGETALIAACRACGARYQDGLGLLVEQAIATMRIFEVAQGVSLDIDREAIYAAIADAS